MVILTNAPEAYDYGATTPLNSPLPEGVPADRGYRLVSVLMPYAVYQLERYQSGLYCAEEVSRDVLG